jgi:hypothetical protein
MKGCLIVLLAMFAAVAAIVWFEGDRNQQPGAPLLTADRSLPAMAMREQAIRDAIEAGVFQRIDVSTRVPQAWTGTAWRGLTYDQKATFINGVAAQHADLSTGLVVVIDGSSGKKIGQFSATRGLQLE